MTGAPPTGQDDRVTSVDIDPEKPSDHAPSGGKFYISHEKMEELAPNGEGEYIQEKIDNMSEEEALAIVKESLSFHSDDWNFPSVMRDRMQRLLEGPEAYGKHWDRDLRIDATMMRYSSPYPGVRAVACPTDDVDTPVETIRAYFLGVSWAIIGTFTSTLFSSRFPSISLGQGVIQILIYPCAKALEALLPDWGITLFGTRHSLNPGPWNFKEQMFATITFNIAIYTVNSYTMILVQKLDVFYGEKFIDFNYQLMLTLFVQLMGMGFAGYLRRFSVYPVKALWPTILPIIAMNRALTTAEVKENIDGWTVSRYRFFYIATGCMFVYNWLPGYLFTALSTFNWMTWIAPQNLNLAILTGSQLGLGLFNPITTFDWNVASSSYNATVTPFWATCTQYFSSLFGGVIILIMYYRNMYNTSYIPPNSTTAFANDGTPYQVQKVVVNNKLDQDLYQQYSPPFYTAGYILTVGANFAFYPVYFLYTMGNQWKTMSQAYVNFYKGLRHGKGNFEGAMDVHCRLMARFPEVPDWWFLLILALSLVVAIVFLRIYPELNTPIWLLFLLLGVNLVFAVPISFVSATTGTNLGLNSLLQVVTGYALPNNPNAFLFAQALGGWALAGYGDNYVLDQKLAHYCKIAPRAVFRSQIGTIIITCFVAVGTQNFILTRVPGLCTADQPSRFTCAGDGVPMYASSLMWGLLGSERMFGHMYPLFKWCFLMGVGIAAVFLAGQGYGPRYLPRVRDHLRRRLQPGLVMVLEYTLFPLVASLLWLNPILVIQGVQHWAPSNMSYKTPGFLLSIFFMYQLPRHRLAWWEKYNYVLGAALGAGVAFSALAMSFAVGFNGSNSLKWWGNTVSSAGLDGQQIGILPIPERGYFGPERGTFP